MTYETYDPTKHTLEVGRTIRLGGREGEIYHVEHNTFDEIYNGNWDDGNGFSLDISKFPALEIAVSPLTIDKRVKVELLKLAKGKLYGTQYYAPPDITKIIDYLNSLEET